MNHKLFPLDCRRWFGRDVIANTIDTLHLIDNLVAHLCHEVVREMIPTERLYTSSVIEIKKAEM